MGDLLLCKQWRSPSSENISKEENFINVQSYVKTRSILQASIFSVFTLVEIVIWWVYYTIMFGFRLFWPLLDITFQVLNNIVWLRITDEG